MPEGPSNDAPAIVTPDDGFASLPASPDMPGGRRPYRVPAAQDLARIGMAAQGRLRLRVTGDSMAPLLRPGDAVELEAVDPAALRRGDVLVLSLQSSLMTHRLIGRQGETLIAKGDNRPAADPPIPAAGLVGRVHRIERGRRRIWIDRGVWPVLNRLLGWLGAVEVAAFALEGRAGLRAAGVALRRLRHLLVRAALRASPDESGRVAD